MKNNYISLKENKNRIIYILIQFEEYDSEYISLLFTSSNYALLYPLSHVQKRTYYQPILYKSTNYLFVDILKYSNTFNFNINHQMNIIYYFFETNNLERIESKIPFTEHGKEAEITDLSFSIKKLIVNL